MTRVYSLALATLVFLILGTTANAQTDSTEDGRARSSRSRQRIVTIVVEGNRKIEKDAILERIGSRENSVFSEEQIRKDVLALFETGFFNDIEVRKGSSAEGVILTYLVEEKPPVLEYIYAGNSELGDDELAEAAELKAYQLLNIAQIQSAIVKMRKLYEEKGFFLAEVDYKIEEAEGEEAGVRVRFDIQENDKVKVKKISFLGNKYLSDEDLKSVMMTKEGGLFSFLSGSGAYKQDVFDRDVQMLNYRYFNEGFVQVKIGRPEVYVTPNKKAIYITVPIEEGLQYRVGKVEFAGDLMFPRDELQELVQIDDAEIFIWEKMQADIRALEAKYGDLGYAYTNIIPRTPLREEERKVDIIYEIDKGSKVYFRRIDIAGNTKTRDKVIRRELRIHEGELYNETRRRESEANIRRLGFFENVQFNTKTPSGEPDRMDIEIVVKERNTGSIQVGAGYSSASRFVFNGQVHQTNLFGRGQSLSARLETSYLAQRYNLNFTEPYFLDTEWSLGFDAYRTYYHRVEFDEVKNGGAVRVGHPLGEYWRAFARYKLEDTDVDLDTEYGDPAIFPTDTVNGSTSSVTLTMEYDRRDDRWMPSSGLFASTSLEYAGLGGDIGFTKFYTNLRYYKKLFWEVVFRNNLTYGYIQSNDPDKEPPFTELFRLGGPYNLRGFDFATVGRRVFSPYVYNRLLPGYGADKAREEAYVVYGGEQEIFLSSELQFPLIKEAGILGVVFFDVGNAADTLILDELRSNVGFGFRWFSPIGPLRFEWGFPLDRKPEFGEDPVNFEFAIGAPF